MIVTLENAKHLLADYENPVILVTPIYGLPLKYIKILWWRFVRPERKYWILQKELTVQLSNGGIITIPKGFKTDLSSVPRLLQGIVSAVGDFALAAIIHDYLYIYKGVSREFADKEMLIWSEAINPNPEDNQIRYIAVRKFGQKWWDGKGEFIQQ